MSCSRCGIHEDDWTPGCRACTSRHYKRAVRSTDPDVLVRHHARAREHMEARTQEQARRQRDGESHADVYARRRSGADGEFPFRRAVTT